MKTTRQTFARLFLVFSMLSVFFPGTLFAYQAQPLAQTREVTFITEKSAKLGGRVNPSEMPDTFQWFEWGLSGRTDIVYETPHLGMWGGIQLVNTSADIIGLAPNTQYFYRQIAENGHGRNVGQTLYFTTKPLALEQSPIVISQTNPPSSITEGSAILRGYVSPHGNATVKWWFQWGETSALENETTHSGWGADSGPVQVMITTLKPGTPYFYRLVAENSTGRILGTTRVFVTLGVPPPPPEAPRAQTIPTPQVGGDGVSRTTTNSGAAQNTGLVQPLGQNLPGDFFGAFFGRKTNTATQNGNTVAQPPTPPVNNTVTSGAANTEAQVASVSTSGPLGAFWNTLTGKGVEVTLEKVGPKKAPGHTPVEYRVGYSYRVNTPAKDGKLKITLPADVLYIGDNTTNELLLEEGVGPERTYILLLGQLEKGSTRTISILGMTTGDAQGAPDARARIEYVDAKGNVQVIAAGNGDKTANTASVSKGVQGGFIPNSLLGWLLYLAFVTGFIFVLRKTKSYYDKRKEEIALREEESHRNPGLEPVR